MRTPRPHPHLACPRCFPSSLRGSTGRQGHFPPTASPAPSAASQRIAPRGQPGPKGKSGLNVTERYLSLAAPRDGAASLTSPVRCPVRWQRHSKSHCQTHRAVSFWVTEPTQLAPAHPARTSTPTSRDSHSRLSPPSRTADRPGSPSLGAPVDTPPATPGPASRADRPCRRRLRFGGARPFDAAREARSVISAPPPKCIYTSTSARVFGEQTR